MTGDGEILLVACYELGHQPLSLAWPAAFLRRAGFRPAVMDLSVEPFDAEKARRAVREGKVASVNGKDVTVRADCICVHSDTPNAVEVARAVKTAVAEYLA